MDIYKIIFYFFASLVMVALLFTIRKFNADMKREDWNDFLADRSRRKRLTRQLCEELKEELEDSKWRGN